MWRWHFINILYLMRIIVFLNKIILLWKSQNGTYISIWQDCDCTPWIGKKCPMGNVKIIKSFSSSSVKRSISTSLTFSIITLSIYNSSKAERETQSYRPAGPRVISETTDIITRHTSHDTHLNFWAPKAFSNSHLSSKGVLLFASILRQSREH